MQSTFRYGVFAGNAGNAYVDTGELLFTWEGVQGVTRIMEFEVWDAAAVIRMSYDGTLYGPEIEIDQDNPPVQIPHAAKGIQIRNKTPGSISRYQVVGYW